MTNPDYTALLFIIDRSGSMYSIQKDMEGGIEAILKEQAELPGKVTVDVAYFDDQFEYADSLLDINDAAISIVPRGSTALHDAIVRASSQFGTALEALAPEDRPGTVLITIVTDGHENSSTENTVADVKKVITEQQDTYNWNYVFLGANQDAVLTGASFGLRKGASLSYIASAAGTLDAATLTSGYISAVRVGNVASF